MDKAKFTNLILLIGTNPLPDFVVAQYFLKNNNNIETIWLIHSEDNIQQMSTYFYAQRLERILKEKWEDVHQSLKFPLEKISLSDVSDARQIKNDLQQSLGKNLSSEYSFHLNYTGGTKSMSIHVHEFLKEFSHSSNNSFSYLDARKFRIVDDDKGEIASELIDNISIDFKSLIDLHGFERINSDSDLNFSSAIIKISELIEQNRLSDLFNKNNGYDRSLFINEKGDLAVKTKQLNEENIKKFIPNTTFLTVIQSMPEEYRLFNSEKEFNWEISSKKIKKAIEFFDGKWLEEYVAQILENVLDPEIIPVYKNWEIKKPEWHSDAKFELDVILLYGYQLTGISCTTDKSKKLCKSKGFEIIHRARQIGGDESKAVIATFASDEVKRALQEELIHDTGGTKKNILVLGEDDLKKENLISEFKNFLFND